MSRDDSYSQGRIVVMPGRVGGEPTLGDSRLPVWAIASAYLHGGREVISQGWDYVTDLDIKLACWWCYEEGHDVPEFVDVWAAKHARNLRAGRWDQVPMPQ